MATGYRYHPLNVGRREIRLLRVLQQGSASSAPLKCRIEHVSLDQETLPAYNAVSYTWGTSAARRTIVIDDQTVDVPESAEVALRNLGQGTRGGKWNGIKSRMDQFFYNITETFWIDAICIDQQNLPERSEQVRLMGDVYSKANATLIWLGQGEDDRAKRAQRILKRIKEFQANFEAILDLSRRDWDALDSIYSAMWFTRTWTIQEALLPRHAFCQKALRSFDWGPVYVFATIVELLSNQYPSEFRPMEYLSESGFQGLKAAEQLALLQYYPKTLSSLLIHTWGTSVTDLRDKVYGVLGLLQDGIPDGLVIDYESSVEETFVTATRAAITHDRSLQLLEDIHRRIDPNDSRSKSMLPSWVPPFHWTLRSSPKGAQEIQLPESLSDLFDYEDTRARHILRARGLIIDEIGTAPHEVIGEQHFGWEDASNVLELNRGLVTIQQAWHLAKAAQPRMDDDELSDMLFETLVPEMCFATGEVNEFDPVAANSTYLRELFSSLLRAARSDADWSDRSSKRDVSGFFETFNPLLIQLYQASFGRRLTTTTHSRRIGTVWPAAQKGDQICVLFGAKVLFILRPNGDKWTIVGDAYVHGAMKGEDVTRLQAMGALESEIRWFDLQ